MSEEVRRLWSTFALRRGHADLFRSAVFKKTNSLRRLMSARRRQKRPRRSADKKQTSP